MENTLITETDLNGDRVPAWHVGLMIHTDEACAGRDGDLSPGTGRFPCVCAEDVLYVEPGISRGRLAEGRTIDSDNVDRDFPEGDGSGSGSRRPGPSRDPRWVKIGDRFAVKAPGASAGDTVEVAAKSGRVSTVVLGELVDDETWLPAVAEVEGYRFRKLAGEWYVTGPACSAGDEVTVTKANGETKTVWITKANVELDGALVHAMSWDAPAGSPAATPSVDVEAGRMYATADDRIVRAQESKAGRLYGKVLDRATLRFEYEASALRDVVRPLTLEEAQAFGRETGTCCSCARELTNPASIEAGIGPVCASKF